MVAFSPATFATVIVSALRLGREGYAAYLNSLVNEQDFRVFVPQLSHLTDPKNLPSDINEADFTIESMVLELLANHGEYGPGEKHEKLFVLDKGVIVRGARSRPVLAPGSEKLFEGAVLEFVMRHEAIRKAVQPVAEARHSLMVYHHKVWSNPKNQSPWAGFFRHFIDVSLDVLAVQPGLLGFGGNLENLLTAMVPNLAQTFDAEGKNAAAMGPATQLAHAFAESALKTLADNPNLVTTEDRWKPLIAGVLRPLQQEVSESGFSQLASERHLREIIGGPVAFGVLTALAENSDAFLKGGLRKDTVLGEVVRQTIGAISSTGPDGQTIRKVFTAEGGMMVFKASLEVAKSRPELFIRGGKDNQALTSARSFLAGVARTVLVAPEPYGENGGLGPEIAVVALDVIGDYTAARLRKRAVSEGISDEGIAAAEEILSGLMSGFKSSLQEEASAGGNPFERAFERVFTQEQAVDVLRILARHVAASPHIMIGKNASEQARALAESVAGAVAADTEGLLTGDDWRRVLGSATELALANPGRLFGIDPQKAENAVAMRIVTAMIAEARAAHLSDKPLTGKVLFGPTLVEGMRIALAAATSGAITVLREQSEVDKRIAAIGVFCRRLNALAASEDARTVIGSNDWLTIFSFYIAEILETGGAAPEDISDRLLMGVLRAQASATSEAEG
jgi:hypothetical protein